MWRLLAILSLGLGVVGVSMVVSSFVLESHDYGSCPAATSTTPAITL